MQTYIARKKLSVVAALSLFVITNVSSGFAQEWVRNMFEEKSYDFGNVPKGAKVGHAFEFSNKYEENLHIAGVRSSCGCTTPRIEKADLKTYEKGAIICEFNTRSFEGPKSAVVTVVFDRPYAGEMQLMVSGNVRSDIVTEPGEVNFGEVEQGTEKSSTISVLYAGTEKWEIKDVRSEDTNLGVVLASPKQNGAGRLEYQMKVRVKDTAPAGELNSQIVLVTNDVQDNQVAIRVRGRIMPPLVLPDSVELGTVATGTKLTGRIFLRGKSPFAITKVECDDPRLTFTPPPGEKTNHIIQLAFDAAEKTGPIHQQVKVYTTLKTGGEAITFVKGNVVAK